MCAPPAMGVANIVRIGDLADNRFRTNESFGGKPRELPPTLWKTMEAMRITFC